MPVRGQPPEQMTGMKEWLAMRAGSRRRAHLQRHRQILRDLGNAAVALQDDTLVNFSSNDYLGLAGVSSLAEAMARGARECGVGSGASALVTGYREAHRSLEEELSGFLGRERTLLFPSGYQANLAVLSSLASRDDVIVQDRLCHASLVDGARLSGAQLRRFPHADMEGLQRQLERPVSGHVLVVSDGIFSMDGDRAPLDALARISARQDAWLVVDDAHGIGVTGPGGRGSVAQAGLSESEVPVLVGTLGKAFGCQGAFVSGSAELIAHLVNEGRTYLFTTAMSPALAEAAREALRRVREDDWRRQSLRERIEQFRQGAAGLGLALMESDTAIQPVMAGDAEAALEISRTLAERGFLVTAIRPPTVPVGGSRLRVTLSAAHSEEQVERLLDALAECMDSR
jgi:8-amino-7-oxononanoate synthase